MPEAALRQAVAVIGEGLREEADDAADSPVPGGAAHTHRFPRTLARPRKVIGRKLD